MKLPTNQLYFTEIGPPPNPAVVPGEGSLSIRKEVVFPKVLLADAGISSAEIAIHTAAEFQHELEDLLDEYRSEMEG